MAITTAKTIEMFREIFPQSFYSLLVFFGMCDLGLLNSFLIVPRILQNLKTEAH